MGEKIIYHTMGIKTSLNAHGVVNVGGARTVSDTNTVLDIWKAKKTKNTKTFLRGDGMR